VKGLAIYGIVITAFVLLGALAQIGTLATGISLVVMALWLPVLAFCILYLKNIDKK